ncbi:hypothetical protein DSC_02210 [Pseudoxanthomonas spadix BD-a59]|uniref:Uncharacterized protein n=1 Tax=Pseudoxanthomonas spadix (strain BD-a59) TaxID=1045855 RepID=G7UV16_PSEUP|nr:hypothetical protein DSC_02210 [Pseudoxanthomonas spadix BD-a59]
MCGVEVALRRSTHNDREWQGVARRSGRALGPYLAGTR